ncbi:hypothetical protein [Leifsonia sp. NPDC080035]|uniref:Uncharacterized protein n=1 Tax=Leifsonia sp. NPDC080035 TaxID=3143936 RepID=A0AAU7GD85_9MICO
MSRRQLVIRAVGCVLAALVIGLAAWFFGMDAPHAVGLGAVIFALGALLSLVGERADVTWPVPAPAARPGARRDVVQLGWSLGARGGRVSPEAVRRLRGLAARVLEQRGVDMDDPRAATTVAELLGENAVAMLRKGSAAAPRPAEVAAVLSTLEALARDASGGRSTIGPAAADPVRSAHR